MKNIWIIIKKELKRFFTDKRMLASLILPGVMIFVLYSFMGNIMGSIAKPDDDYEYKIAIVNKAEQNLMNEHNGGNFFAIIELVNKVKYIDVSAENETEMLEKLTNDEIDLYVVYEDGFFNNALSYDASANVGDAPRVEIYFNSTNKESSNVYQLYTTSLMGFNNSISKKFDINPDSDKTYNLATDKELAASIITMLIPFLLIIFLFTGAMSISIESIAGEKERGTIATLLATPVKRSEFALGKIIALSIVSMVSATSSFLGLFLSIPKLIGEADVNFNIYGPGTYILLFIVLITTTLVFVVLISLISAYAKSVKEASSLSSILMIVNMAVTIPSMAGVSSSKTGLYFIPIYNSVQSLTSILSFEVNPINILITILVNLAIVALGTFGLTKMFNSEKIMFNK